MTLLTPILAVAALRSQDAKVVEVPFRIGETAIIVDATVNGRKLALMFDSGFSGAVNVGDEINLGKATGKIILRDFVGEMEASTTEIKSLKVGDKVIKPVGMEAVMTPGGDYSFAYGQHCDGLLGLQTLKDEIVEINFEKNKFIFHPSTYDITKLTPDNKRTFLARLLPTGHSALEMTVTASTGDKMQLALDTGNSFYATTYRETLERVRVWPSSKNPQFTKQSGVASGAVDSWDVRLKDFKIFGVPVPSGVWDVIERPSSSAQMDGTVGFGFLKNFNITIDYARRRVWLENFNGKVSDDEPGDVGISAVWSPERKRAIIVRVSPESPAAKAGVKKGDQLLSVDGVEVVNYGFKRMRRIFEGPVGAKVKFDTSRDGEVMRYELTRASLVNEP